MLPSRSGILAKAISIASTSLKQRHSISRASFLQYPHFRSSRPESFCKKGFLKNFDNSQVFSLAQMFPVNLRNFKEHFFHRIPPMVPSGICTNRNFLF